MTDEDKKALAEAIASQLEDSAYGIATEADRDRTALLVADHIEHALYQQGWMPPATYHRVASWAFQTGNLPEHHINRDVVNSQLAELAAILHDR